MLFDNNTLRCVENGGFSLNSGAGCSAPIGLFGDNTAINHVTVTNNLFAGTSSGHWCSYTGANQPGKPYPTGTNIVWTNNRYDAGQCKHAGGYLGPVADWAANAGNVWCGNSFTDGTTTGLPAEVGCGTVISSTSPPTSSSTTKPTVTTSTSSTTAPTTPTTETATVICHSPPLVCKVTP